MRQTVFNGCVRGKKRDLHYKGKLRASRPLGPACGVPVAGGPARAGMIGRFDQSPAGPFMIAILLAVVFLIGPLLFGVAGVRHAARGPGQDGAPRTWEGRLVLRSALLYTLAFNLTFFLQELFLVLPKALTPGLKPTLFHNNHTWQGDSPWVGLLQGSGALAIFVSGVLCALLVRRCAARSRSLRLFLTWMAYCGLFQSLPQVMIGSVNPLNDVGMALQY